MILTDKNITVTSLMLERANMWRYQNGQQEVGVPVDPANPSLGVRWKKLFGGGLTDADFDAIEQYFLQKTRR